MTKWEYLYKEDLGENWMEAINKLGEDGWELVVARNGQFIFKRSKSKKE